ITNPNGEATTFAYDALGRRTSLTHANGVVTTYSYDAASQLLSLVHQLGATTINSFSYTYDKVGNRTAKTDNNGTANYTYDALNRLVQAVNPLPSNPLESFTYDPVGNRVNSNQNGLSTFNTANQLTEDGTFAYVYDANGNEVQKTSKITGLSAQFEYDAENKLIRVVREDGSTVNYKYDGLGRRVQKEIVDVTTTVTRYIYDNEDILLELDGSDNIVARYTHGPGIDEPLIMEKAGQSFFYNTEGLGSITELIDTSGTVAQAYTYSSFGEIESQLNATFVQPYTFTAREMDPQTGLYYYRSRYLDSRSARFTSEDLYNLGTRELPSDIQQHLFPPRASLPGLKTNPQNQNRYVYVKNNPVNRIDPFGFAETCIWGGFSGAGALVIGLQMIFQKGVCTDDCGNRSFKTRNCLCVSLGVGLSGGVGFEKGDTSRMTEGWTAGGVIMVSGSGGQITGFSVGPGAGVFYSWCACDVF
ncbi:hypothetical protein MYX65_12710, partial [Acidobacteria bacterium AH-259-L09]|nr:hypothetical protein [Acidobacteria bacterium AH-259-L09]